MKNLGFVLLLVVAFGFVACFPGCDGATDEVVEPATDEVQVDEVESPGVDTENEVIENEVVENEVIVGPEEVVE